tara:strand:- start:95 stop:304 length:210 start_codon:yes stop_codon:yes gene_type:complete
LKIGNLKKDLHYIKHNIRRNKMPKAKKKTTTRKKRTTKKNIVGNWRGIEDRFFTKVRNGFKALLKPVSK